MASLEMAAASAAKTTDEQGVAFADLLRRWRPYGVTVRPAGDGLAEGWLLVVLHMSTSDFTCGIAPDGAVSS